ncbi:MAG: damage-inducible protein DinB [Bacteroidetes bacterium]|nr:damage-inducible protein DinB [Bacteroidota bacterium]
MSTESTPTTAPPATAAAGASFISPEAMLEHWQGHRRLTRRMLEAFPDDQLFTFSVGSMRPFGALILEMLSMAEPMVRGTVTGAWESSMARDARPKEELLRLWDETTEKLNELWPQIPPERFSETIMAFGQYEGRTFDLLLYVIDNEIHHRGQGYVYMRALGLEPPPFYERHLDR